MNSPQPSSEAKFWAILSHLAILAGGLGLLLPAFGWSENREKSHYGSFQALQALVYQTLGYTLWVLVYLLASIVVLLVSLPFIPKDPNSPAMAVWTTVHLLVIVIFFAVLYLVPVVGAVLCAFGRDFRYPLIGNRLARYIGYDPAAPDAALNTEHEDRAAVSMGHFSIVFSFFGLFVPLALWVTQAKRSRFAEFQSVQALVFQALSTLVTLGLSFLAMLILAISVLPVFMAVTSGAQPSPESFLGFFVFLLCLMVLVLVIPLLQILGQWAGLRILQGHDYHYPLIGARVEKWLSRRGTAKAS